LFQGRACSGEAALDEAGLVLDLLQAVPDDLHQVGEAGDGEVGQYVALEDRPDSLPHAPCIPPEAAHVSRTDITN
jgi:hypothetical protein